MALSSKQPKVTVDDLPDHLKGQGAAVILLLSELPADEQVAIIRAACPGIIAAVAEGNLKANLHQLVYRVEEALNIADGSSGLGALAAKNLNTELKFIRNHAKGIATTVGVKTKL